MLTRDSVEDSSWWTHAHPSSKELYLSGGLQVEDWPHARYVTNLSTQLFHETYSLHHMDDHALRLLERAAYLHNTGMLIEARRHHKHSFRLIKETHLPDFSEQERYEIACIARYHRRAMPSKDHPEYAALSREAKKRVSTLAALLRIADALDYNHDGRVLHITTDPEQCNGSTWTFVVSARPLADLDEELGHAHDKADLFEKMFKRKVRFVVRS